MAEPSVDVLLRVLGNSTRRKILEKLAKETHYPLQLSRELRVSQQAIVKHLKVLEDLDLVQCKQQKSDLGGPTRKAYFGTKRFSIVIDVGPHLFETSLRYFNVRPGEAVRSADLQEKQEHILRMSKKRERLKALSDLIGEIDRRVESIENKRASLIGLKNSILEEAHKAVGSLGKSYEERKVLYHILGRPNRSTSTISEELDIREKAIEDILRQLRERKIAI